MSKDKSSLEFVRVVGIKYQRADGRVMCQKCNKPYNKHPVDNNHPWLNRLCDGRLVKL